MKTLSLLKFVLFVVCAGIIMPLYALKPGVWTIIRSDALYAGGAVQAENPLRGKIITDIAMSGSEFWIATTDNFFSVTDESTKAIVLGSPIKLGTIPAFENRQIPYGRSAIYPTLSGNAKKAGITMLVSGMGLTSEDGKKWDFIKPASSIPEKGDELPFTEFTATCSSEYGWAISGFIRSEGKVGCGIFYSTSQDYGPERAFIDKEEMDRAKEDKPFGFFKLNRDKNGTVWAMGGNKKKRLWKVAMGKIQYVDKEISDITIDPQGNAVVATPTGIMTIDKENNMEILHEYGARSVAFDQAGILWYEPPKQSSQSDDAYTITELINLKKTNKDRAAAKEAQFQKTPENALLVRYNLATGEKFLFTAANCPLRGKIYKIISDSKNYKYILMGEDDRHLGIYIIKEPDQKLGEWTVTSKFFDGEAIAEQNYWDFSCTGTDGTFVGVNRLESRQISFFDGTAWKREPYEIGRTGLFFVLTSVAYMNNVVYVGTSDYVYAMENGKMLPLEDINKKLISKVTSALAVDHNNNLWIGSTEGLAMYDGKTYTYYDKKTHPGLPNVRVLSLCTAGDHVFVGTTDGLSVYDGTDWKYYDKKTGLENKRVTAIAANSKGQVFIASASAFLVTNVLQIYQNGELTSETIPQKIAALKMVFDADDNLWIQSRNDLTCRKADGEYVFYESDKTFPVRNNQMIKNLACVNGEVWLSIGAERKTATTAPQAFEAELSGKLTTFDGLQALVRKKE